MHRPANRSWQHARVSLTRRQIGCTLGVAVVLVLLVGWALVRGDGGTAAPVLGPDLGPVTTPTAPPGFVPPGEAGRTLLDGFDEMAITVQPAGGGDSLFWCLLAALTAEQRERGLMEVTDLGGYSGMVFVYDFDSTNSFYMRNTPTPLSIAWVALDGRVVSIKDMAPCEDRDGCPTYGSGGTYRYAIEVFQGDLLDLGITEDATVTVGGSCSPA